VARTLSAGAQAARKNNYASLANFKLISASKVYQVLAGRYATNHKLKDRRAPLRSTSKLARLYGRTYLMPDGTFRKVPNKRYRPILAREAGITLDQLDLMEDY